MQVYLPVHQATCREEILDRIDPFGFDNQTVIRYIKHFDDSGRADVTFRYACIKAVAAKIIKSVHIQLTAYELMQKAFRVFVLEDLNGKTQLAVHLFVHPFHQHKRNLFVRDSFYNRVFQYMRESKELIRNDRERERKKYERTCERLNSLVITAPLKGQLSFVKVTSGQQVSSGESIAEIKVLDQYKIHTSLSEYYIDRITTGLPATVNYQGNKYPLKITKVVPEVKDRMFDVDLVFTGDMPDNVRVGKSFRVQIELGQPEQALIIPRGNFYQSTGGQWIYKVNTSKTKAVRVPLSIGRQNPQQYEIVEGLQPGDWVITTGYDTFGDAEELILK